MSFLAPDRQFCPPSHRKRRRATRRRSANPRTHQQNHRPKPVQPKPINPTAATKSLKRSRHRQTCPTAISCLGAFRSLSASAPPYSRMPATENLHNCGLMHCSKEMRGLQSFPDCNDRRSTFFSPPENSWSAWRQGAACPSAGAPATACSPSLPLLTGRVRTAYGLLHPSPKGIIP